METEEKNIQELSEIIKDYVSSKSGYFFESISTGKKEKDGKDAHCLHG